MKHEQLGQQPNNPSNDNADFGGVPAAPCPPRGLIVLGEGLPIEQHEDGSWRVILSPKLWPLGLCVGEPVLVSDSAGGTTRAVVAADANARPVAILAFPPDGPSFIARQVRRPT